VGGFYFITFVSPRKSMDDNLVFNQQKGCHLMLLTCVSNQKYNLKYKYQGSRRKISGKRKFYKNRKNRGGPIFEGVNGDDNLLIKLNGCNCTWKLT
jgi:hypothetical protein